MGGAVSSISYMDLMLYLGKGTDLAVYNITFGSPFFANETVRKRCKEERFDQRMIHYVGHKDIVPGVLSLGHTVAEIQKRLNEVTGGMYDVAEKLCSDYLPVAAKVASFVLKNLPGTNEDVKVLCNLTGTLLSDIKQTEIGRQFFLDEFVPIGNFFVLQPDALSTLTPN